jgi:hypothetical protein
MAFASKRRTMKRGTESVLAGAERAVAEACTRGLEEDIDTVREALARIAESGDSKLVEQATELAVRLHRKGYL